MKPKADIPLVDLAAQHAPLRDELRAAFERVLDESAYILGEEVAAFEQEMAAALGVPHVIGVSSGSDALLVSLMALGVGPGDEVITSPFTFFATVGAIVRVGATPVFVDIEPDTFLLDATQVEQAITKRTRAIMPVHLFGQACDLAQLRTLCATHGLHLVEDAAQAIGASRDGMPVGQAGDYGCFSLFPAKNLGAFGDAGFVSTTSAELAERARTLRAHGGQRKYHHERVGGNFRLDALQAALLRVKLPLLQGITSGRRGNAARYDTLFTGLDPARVTTPVSRGPGHVYNQYTLRVAGRDGLRAHLQAQGIGCAVYYPDPLHLQPCFAHLGQHAGDFPVAEQACQEVLSIPVYPELPAADLERVATEVVRWAEGV